MEIRLILKSEIAAMIDRELLFQYKELQFKPWTYMDITVMQVYSRILLLKSE